MAAWQWLFNLPSDGDKRHTTYWEHGRAGLGYFGGMACVYRRVRGCR